MTITTSGTSVTFNDSTTQATAFLGLKGQIFTSNGTFTIPSGVTALKIIVVGGGGGDGGGGGASQVSSGSQSISTITANGGNQSVANNYSSGGTASGGQFNVQGGYSYSYTVPGLSAFGLGRGSIWSGSGYNGSGGGGAISFLTGLTSGATISVTVGAAGAIGSSGVAATSGVVIFTW